MELKNAHGDLFQFIGTFDREASFDVTFVDPAENVTLTGLMYGVSVEKDGRLPSNIGDVINWAARSGHSRLLSVQVMGD